MCSVGKKLVPVRVKCFLNAEILLLSYIISIYDLFLLLLAAQTGSLKANVTLKLSFKVSSLYGAFSLQTKV